MTILNPRGNPDIRLMGKFCELWWSAKGGGIALLGEFDDAETAILKANAIGELLRKQEQ